MSLADLPEVPRRFWCAATPYRYEKRKLFVPISGGWPLTAVRFSFLLLFYEVAADALYDLPPPWPDLSHGCPSSRIVVGADFAAIRDTLGRVCPGRPVFVPFGVACDEDVARSTSGKAWITGPSPAKWILHCVKLSINNHRRSTGQRFRDDLGPDLPKVTPNEGSHFFPAPSRGCFFVRIYPSGCISSACVRE